MPDTTPKPGSGLRGWLRVVLFASLALNLVIVGVVAGALLRDGGPGGPRGPGRDGALPYTAALSDDQRRAVRRAIVAARENNPAKGRWLPGYTEAIAILRAEQFDAAALEAVLIRQAEASRAYSDTGRAALLAAVAEMSAEDRAAYADRLEEAMARLRNRGPRKP